MQLVHNDEQMNRSIFTFPEENKIQFAVVREDPNIEIELVKKIKARKILLIGSGGCTALSLNVLFNNTEINHIPLEIMVCDVNPFQIKLLKHKIETLTKNSNDQIKQKFNIGHDLPNSLNGCGNFESLFRTWRYFINEFMIQEKDIIKLLKNPNNIDRTLDNLFLNKFWPISFELFFSDIILEAIFGSAATQHSGVDKYSTYFKKVIEKGLKTNKNTNYFLHYILLGHYLKEENCLPLYLKPTINPDSRTMDYQNIQLTNSAITEIKQLNDYDIISLSNIFDWIPESEIKAISKILIDKVKPGCYIIFRQLNHFKNFKRFFENHFKFNEDLENKLLLEDRSLFYTKLNIGVSS